MYFGKNLRRESKYRSVYPRNQLFSNFRQKGEWFLFEDTEIEEFNKQIFNLDLVTVIIPEHNPFVVFTNFDENNCGIVCG